MRIKLTSEMGITIVVNVVLTLAFISNPSIVTGSTCDTFYPTLKSGVSTSTATTMLNQFYNITISSLPACYDPSFVEIESTIKVMFIFENKSYEEAAAYCKTKSSLLTFKIPNARVQGKVAAILQATYTVFVGTDEWWFGLDDVDDEGKFVLKSGYELGTGYSYWNPSMKSSHPDEDCGIMEASSGWKWNVEDCNIKRPFMCQKVNCENPSKYSPTEPKPGTPCSPACSQNYECIEGNCMCMEMFSKINCSWASGMNADSEGKNFGKNFVFFNHTATWQDAKEYCREIDGILVVPSTMERHDFIYKKIIEAGLNSSYAAWLGFSDIETEGVWKFENGEFVSFSPNFGDLTGGGQIPLYHQNTTSIDERWHFYYDIGDLYVIYQEAVDFCAKMDGHLAVIRDADENSRISRRVKYYYPIFNAKFPRPPFRHDSTYIGITRSKGNMTSFVDHDGGPVFMPRPWYAVWNTPLPTEEQLSRFQGWLYPHDPNNHTINPRLGLELCVVTTVYNGWYDISCLRQLHVLCEKGAYPFERWHLGGTVGNYSEPNDGWCNEDCGAMRLDLSDEGRFDFTGTLTEFWNDYDCRLKLPFGCELELPTECDTYMPSLSISCVNKIRTMTGCNGSEMTVDFIQNFFGQKTVIETRNILREFKRKSSDKFKGVYHEVCGGAKFISLSNDTQLLFETAQKTYEGAKTYCDDHDSILVMIKTKEISDFVEKKMKDVHNTSGTEQWWLGLDDKLIEGTYMWSDADDFNPSAGNFSNWSPAYSGPTSALDCVELDASDGMHWNEADCNKNNSFICMKKYPENCTSYKGPHSVSCLTTIWKEVGCSLDGHQVPGNLTSARLNALNVLHLREVRIKGKNTKNATSNYNKTEQLNCYGTVFPENCTQFEGPLSVECLTSIWLKVGCKHSGNGIPYKISESARLNLWKNYSISSTIDEMTTAPLQTALSGNKSEQMRCYGKEFPEGCKTYEGPHTPECLKTIWKKVGCIEEGYDYPDNLTDAENATLNAMNIDQVENQMQNTSDNALISDENSQLDCYGMKFFNNCDTYHPPLSPECLSEIWKEKVGCVEEGLGYPGSLSASTLKSIWGEANQREAKDGMDIMRDKALSPDEIYQKQCYGIVFPNNCTTYYGPHSRECLKKIWKEVGCTDDGFEEPYNLSTSQYDALKVLNLKNVRTGMTNTQTAAENNNKTEQLNCYGIVFPENCTQFEGPLSIECLTSIWLKVGCKHSGNGIPYKISSGERTALWKDYNIKTTIAKMTSSPFKSALNGNVTEQKRCYGKEFPEGCKTYEGPHTPECLKTIWKKVGCIEEGYDYPDNLTDAENATLNAMNIERVETHMQNTNDQALSNDTQAQFNCYGMKFFNNCDTYDPVLPTKCLEEIWTKEVGCTEKGLGFPGNLSTGNITSTYGTKNQRAIKELMQGVRDKADSRNITFQMQCYGIELPENCTFYPKHTDECLSTIWTNKIGCHAKGTHYPRNLDLANKSLLYDNATLFQVIAKMENQSNDQMKCYGIVFPNDCTYLPPHSEGCLMSLFVKAGCSEDEGTIPTVRKNVYNMSNVDAILKEFYNIKNNSDDATSGIDAETCYSPQFVNIVNTTEVMFVFKGKPYVEAEQFCRSKGSLLLFKIDSLEMQDKMVEKLKNADDYFAANIWWIGLDDIDTEGQFMWNSGIELGTGYSNWNPSMKSSHPDEDCGIMEASSGWKWNVEDCNIKRPFMCQKVNCENPSKYSPFGMEAENESCFPSCEENFECIDGKCECLEMFSKFNCTWASGMKADYEEKKFDKNYLFFNHNATWHQAKAYCDDIWGYLAVPSTMEKHDFIYQKILKAGMNTSLAVWLGFSDTETEGDWKFENGEPVSYAPVFGDLTGGGQIPLYHQNTTSIDERWHFYYDIGDLYLIYQEAVDYCAKMDGHLAVIRDADENNRISRRVKYYFPIFNAKFPRPPFRHDSTYIGIKRSKGNMTSFVDHDGAPVFMPRPWYAVWNTPLPTEEQLSRFQGWLYPHDPNNHTIEARLGIELCVVMTVYNGWYDMSCLRRLHVLCEKGAYPFERWHLGGTVGNYSEPNDGWCNEDCGAMRLDLSDEGRFDFTGTLTEFWNDYDCRMKFPFVCEIDPPTGCDTYMPILPDACLDKIRELTKCDVGHISDSFRKVLANKTSIELRNFLRDLKEKSKNKLEGVYHEVCKGTEFITISPNMTKTSFNLKEKTHKEAEKHCRDQNAILATIKTKEVADVIARKVRNSHNASGAIRWWIGLDDKIDEGLFEWSTGEPFDPDAGHYSNWSPKFNRSTEERDCVVIDVTDDMRWMEVDCNEKFSFICVQVTCDYPMKFGSIHRDECYHFRQDPNQKDPSVYRKTLDRAMSNCEKPFGKLAKVDDQSTSLFFQNFGLTESDQGFSHNAKFWVPLYDVAPPSRINATDRNWQWKEDGATTPLGSFKTFVADEFMISNVGRNSSIKSKLPYEERCLYGDPLKHVYSEPLGPFEAHHYARSKSCNYNHPEELTWVWASTYHLKNIFSGLCLTAPFEQIEDEVEALSPGVRVRHCNLSDSLQHWVCQSRNPFHLKLRKYKYSILYDKVEPWDRACMAGSTYGEDCKSLWRSLNNEYICDERYRPAENLFLVRSSGIKPPAPSDTDCNYPEYTLFQKFPQKQDAKRQCNLRGARPATVAEIRASMNGGFTEGCACAYVYDDDTLRGVLSNVDLSCQGIPGLPSPASGLFVCTEKETEHMWCFRGSMSNENKFFGVQYAPLCATYSFLNTDAIGFEERSCFAAHNFACKRKIPDCCSAPFIPADSYITREDWTVGGDGTTFHCNKGYGVGGGNDTLKIKLNCTESGGARTWQPDSTTLECLRLTCPDPVAKNHSTIASTPPGIPPGGYKYKDGVTYTCDAGYGINGQPKMTTRKSWCGADQTWKPNPEKFKCLEIKCKQPPRVINAKAHFNATEESLYYECDLGYWIKRGQHEVHGFVCNDTGQWVPDPLKNVSCFVLTCGDPPNPPRGEVFITSYRYLANLTVKCDLGLARVPNDLNIICNQSGDWHPAPDQNYCKNITCKKPEAAGLYAVLDAGLKSSYIYADTLQYSCNKTGYELRRPFVIFNPQRLGCLGIDDAEVVSLKTTCNKEDRKVYWAWEGTHQIMSMHTGNCLAASGSNAVMRACNANDRQQKWACPVISDSYLTLTLKDTTTALRIALGTDSVQVTSAGVDDLSVWKVGGRWIENNICSQQNGYPTADSMCTRHGLWSPPSQYIKCIIQQCPPLIDVQGATKVLHGPTPTYGTNATYTCEEGKLFHGNSTDLDLHCDETGNWAPPLDTVHCSPLMCPPPYKVQYASSYGFIWKFAYDVKYTCTPGFWFSRGTHDKIVTCSAQAKWEPDPEQFVKCIPVTCLDPGQRPHSSYYIANDDVAYGSIVEYTCDERYWYRRGDTSRGVTCTPDGSYHPPVASLTCTLAYCSPPDPVSNARMERELGLYDPIYGGHNVTFLCLLNYWIRPSVFSASIKCTNYGLWRPESSTIKCAKIVCDEPYVVPNATLSGTDYSASSRVTVTCVKGFWIEQETDVKSAQITCDPRSATWLPENVTCKETQCSSPGLVEKAYMLLAPSSHSYMETIVYQCDRGHQLENGTFQFATTCQESGKFEPNVNGTVCQPKTCNFTVAYYNNGNITSGNGTYQYLDVVKLQCDVGYWILLDEGVHSLDFVCDENGYFFPNPLYVFCSVVECPAPPAKLHSTMTAHHITYGSTITYTCADGFGSTRRPVPQTVWEMNCLNNGRWNLNPNLVDCRLIVCMTPGPVDGAILIGDVFTYGKTVTFKCHKGKWFDRDVYEMDSTCLATTLWDVEPPPCKVVDCIDPAKVTGHASFVGDDFMYLSLVTVHCDHGFFIGPGKAHATIRCLEDGQWDTSHDNFTCKDVVCPYPPLVWHASIISVNFTRGSVVTYRCDDDYYISRTQNEANVTCTDIARWHPEPNYIKCLSASSFLCDIPSQVDNANILAESFSYESIANITCVNGFWLSPLNYTVSIKCTFSGTWQPDPSLVQCLPISCEPPPVKSHSTYQGSSYEYNSAVHLHCDEEYRISKLSGGKEIMTYMKSMAIVCGGEGTWHPPLNQLSCLSAGCPVPTIPSGMTTADDVTYTYFGVEITFNCVEGTYIKRRVTSATIYCLETGLWIPDVDLIKCHPIQCGIKHEPSYGTFSGMSAEYGESITYKCYDGYSIPSYDDDGGTEVVIEVEVTCSDEGTWKGMDKVQDCEPLTCKDPGYILGSVRDPLYISNKYAIGATLTYQCRNDMWFYRGETSQSITCTESGKWMFGDSQSLLSCQEVMCWHPPHLTNTIKPPSWSTKHLYKIGERVLYQCIDGRRFNRAPPGGRDYYTLQCKNDGKWSELPDGITCELIACTEPPAIVHAAYTRNDTLFPGSNVTYRCTSGYEMKSKLLKDAKDKVVTFNAECMYSGQWRPDPISYTCKVITCPEPPLSIPHGYKHGKVYEAGYHVNYVCEYGYRVAGSSLYSGSRFVTIICRNDATWNVDAAALQCKKVSCGAPISVANTTVAKTGISYNDTATYKCQVGHFINQHSDPQVNISTVHCTAAGRWIPSSNTIYCAPYNCSRPADVEHAMLKVLSYNLAAIARYICDKGYVIDHGEDGMPGGERPLDVSISSTCTYPMSWLPDPDEITCTLIQCPLPVQPRRAYIKGWRWRVDGTRHFRYRDNATLTCAHGYYIEDTDLFSMIATCTHNGTWSTNLTNINCVDIMCPDPGYKLHGKRQGNTLRYLSRMTYTCDHGYFVQPGITKISLQCAYDAKWTPSNQFKCLEVDCGNPGSVSHSSRAHLSGDGNYSMGAMVQYECNDGYHIAQEQDAIGEWVVGEEARSRRTITCKSNGRWRPRRPSIHCSKLTIATTLYELISDGGLLHPHHESELLPQREEKPVQAGRMQNEEGQARFEATNHEDHHTELFIHCETNQVLVVHHLGHWLAIDEESVRTEHVPELLTDVGVECVVYNMFDGEPDTYWMPAEAPLPSEHHMQWKGWVVNIDLKSEHIIGSFRLQTSNNFENDVKTFSIYVSANEVSWKMLGPFHAIVGTKRTEFFYDFEAVQTRFVSLNITATVLMHSPVVTRFGVYGATFDCADQLIYASDSYAVPVFAAFVVLALFVLLLIGGRFDEKTRWKRFILKSPPQFDESETEPARIYEISICTAWNTHNADILLKVIGSEASSPILWLRNSFDGTLRPGYSDTHVLQAPAYLGSLIRVDVMCAYQDKQNLNEPSLVGDSTTASSGSDCKWKSLTTANSSEDKCSSKVSVLSSLRTFFNGENLTVKSALSSAHKTIKSTASKLAIPRMTGYGLSNITVRDPGTGEKWLATPPVDEPANFRSKVWKFLFRLNGTALDHGVARPFPLIEETKSVQFNAVGLCWKQFVRLICMIYQQHVFSWLFFERGHSVVRNFTCIEKILIGTTAVIHTMLAAALLYGFTDHSLYFVSRLGEDSNVLDKLFANLNQHPNLVALSSAAVLLFVFQLTCRVAAGKWSRDVENKLSYWQGTRPLHAALFIIKQAISTAHTYIKLSLFPEETDDSSSVDAASTLSTVSQVHLSVSQVDIQPGEDLVGYLENTLCSTFNYGVTSPYTKVICNPPSSPRKHEPSVAMFDGGSSPSAKISISDELPATEDFSHSPPPPLIPLKSVQLERLSSSEESLDDSSTKFMIKHHSLKRELVRTPNQLVKEQSITRYIRDKQDSAETVIERSWLSPEMSERERSEVRIVESDISKRNLQNKSSIGSSKQTSTTRSIPSGASDVGIHSDMDSSGVSLPLHVRSTSVQADLETTDSSISESIVRQISVKQIAAEPPLPNQTIDLSSVIANDDDHQIFGVKHRTANAAINNDRLPITRRIRQTEEPWCIVDEDRPVTIASGDFTEAAPLGNANDKSVQADMSRGTVFGTRSEVVHSRMIDDLTQEFYDAVPEQTSEPDITQYHMKQRSIKVPLAPMPSGHGRLDSNQLAEAWTRNSTKCSTSKDSKPTSIKSTKSRKSVLHVITHRAYTPDPLGQDSNLASETSLFSRSQPSTSIDSGFSSKHIVHRDPLPTLPNVPVDILVRCLLCAVCILYMTIALAYLIPEGAHCSDGAASGLVEIFLLNIFVLVIVVMPVVGWMVLLVHIIMNKVADLVSVLVRNLL